MSSQAHLYRQYAYNVAAGPHFVAADELFEPDGPNADVRLIAYYLPQFHPTPENDAWWGKGFTEWTNVTKALPRYRGQRQPRLPSELGFYDLRNPETLRAQADLAQRAGIYGFCIHNYWFSGREVLGEPLRVLLDNPNIKLRFCLNWANENWTKRWDGHDEDVLLRQLYAPGDAQAYIRSLLPALRDPRYIRIDGRPLIMVYRPSVVPDPLSFFGEWRALLVAEGMGDPYLVMAQVHGQRDPRPFGFDAAAGFPPHLNGFDCPSRTSSLLLLDAAFKGAAFDYDDMVASALTELHQDRAFVRMPGVCPGWDNEARHPGAGASFYGATPSAYEQWLRQSCDFARRAPSRDERIVFINAWNEWAEGAVLEPDRHHGHAFLAATRRIFDGSAPPPQREVGGSPYEAPRLSRSRRWLAAVRRRLR